MTLGHKFTLAGLIVLAVLLAVSGKVMLDQHDARVVADLTQKFDQKTIDAAKQSAADAEKTLEQKLKSIDSERRAPAPTPQQVVIDVSKLLPNLPTPVKVVEVPAVTAADGTVTAPTQALIVPKEDIPAFTAYKLNCEENSARLDACSAKSASLTTQLAAQTERADTWEKTAKGGSFWKRTKTALKWVGVGAAVGVAVGYAAH